MEESNRRTALILGIGAASALVSGCATNAAAAGDENPQGMTGEEIAVLLALETLRNNPEYHAAEVLRRSTPGGSAKMVLEKESSRAYGAILLLISTWEAIAVMVSSVKRTDRIFEITPVCNMYLALEDAIQALRKTIPGFAANFIALKAAYDAWLKNKDGEYKSAACNGLHAKFG
jgi:hypothetical protein